MQASASRANLLMRCGYWCRPDVEGPPNESGPGARYGIAVHSLTESLSTGERAEVDVAPEDSLRAQDDADALYTWHATHIGGEKYHEQKVAFNTRTRTARVLLEPAARDYSGCVAGEFPGTADLIAVKGDAVCVVDYKTGHTPWEIYKDQLNFLGLAAARIYGVQRAVCVVLKVSEGECYPHHWSLDAEALQAFEDRFVTAFERVAGSEPTPGDHCTSLYCPIAGTCPATMARIGQETGIDMASVPVDGSVRDHEHAAQLYQVKLLLGKSRKVLDDQLKRYVDATGGFPVGAKVYRKDGNSYKECRPIDTWVSDTQTIEEESPTVGDQSNGEKT